MNPTISFAENYNNKLFCNFFTTIRKPDPLKFTIGRVFDIRLLVDYPDHNFGSAKLILKQSFFMNQIRDYLSFMDFGKSAKELRQYLIDIYRINELNENDFELVLLMFEYIDEDRHLI